MIHYFKRTLVLYDWLYVCLKHIIWFIILLSCFNSKSWGRSPKSQYRLPCRPLWCRDKRLCCHVPLALLKNYLPNKNYELNYGICIMAKCIRLKCKRLSRLTPGLTRIKNWYHSKFQLILFTYSPLIPKLRSDKSVSGEK